MCENDHGKRREIKSERKSKGRREGKKFGVPK